MAQLQAAGAIFGSSYGKITKSIIIHEELCCCKSWCCWYAGSHKLFTGSEKSTLSSEAQNCWTLRLGTKDVYLFIVKNGHKAPEPNEKCAKNATQYFFAYQLPDMYLSLMFNCIQNIYSLKAQNIPSYSVTPCLQVQVPCLTCN